MAKKPLPTPEQLRQLLRYEPDTGKLYWRERTPDMFQDSGHTASHICARFNSQFAGREAFAAVNAQGYNVGSIFMVEYRAHRIIWKMMTGQEPKDQIDHINGCRTDNRIENLRETDIFGNNRNVASAKGSSSKYLGVCWEKRRLRWRSVIKVNRKQIALGEFSCEEQAARAYDAAAIVHHGEFARLNFPAHSPT